MPAAEFGTMRIFQALSTRLKQSKPENCE
ncbi:protein of unknown function [Azospirillum baldaniorum]|uniref:Uncharacterized protein n=1 Tax=Azospirillum baldaniorum TaxID=1064539 RepID=A0A9P1JSC8_9PROT|nr:protein of unknown function [Azospirillum baldaniorum]